MGATSADATPSQHKFPKFMAEVIKVFSFAPSLDTYHSGEPSFDSLEDRAIDSALVEDVLFAFSNSGCSSFIIPQATGTRSSYLNVSQALELCKRRFRCSAASHSITALVSSILPLCEKVALVVLFLEMHQGFEFGIVAQKLNLFIAESFASFLSSIAQLEGILRSSDGLSLTGLRFNLQAAVIQERLRTLAGLCVKLWGVQGGQLIDEIAAYKETLGSPEGLAIVEEAHKRSLHAFLPLLADWQKRGIDEFGDLKINSDGRLFLPKILAGLEAKITETAGNLELLRSANYIVKHGDINLEISSVKSFTLFSERIYSRSCSELLLFFRRNMEMDKVFCSFRKFFLAGAGDWLATFLDLSITELEKSVREILPHRLDALLDVAIRASSASSDGFKENLKVKLIVGSQAEAGSDILGIRALTIQPKKIALPLKIIFSDEVIIKYQAIFRNLVYGRWVDRKLGEVWLEFQKNASSAERGSTALLSRMFHFCKNFVFFCAAAADARFHEFLAFSRNSDSFTDIKQKHEKCLDGICADLLLTADSAVLLRSVSKILSTCALFASHLRRFLQLQTQKNFTKEEKFLALIGKFAETFGSQTRSFLKNLEKLKNENADPRFAALLARLDFNDFFSN